MKKIPLPLWSGTPHVTRVYDGLNMYVDALLEWMATAISFSDTGSLRLT